MAEKQATDESIRSLENRNEALIHEVERLRARVMELEEDHGSILQREQDLVHQRQALESSVNDVQQGTLHWLAVPSLE